MSDVIPEATSVAVEPSKDVEDAPATTTTGATESVSEPANVQPTPGAEATGEEIKVEEKKDEPQEAKPITEGFLDFRHQGFFHFIPIGTKKYFYFQDEPIAVENLHGYLKKDKTSCAPANVAFASQTGKGLLFFTKNQEQKAHPTGIIKLADVVEVTTAGTTKFFIKLSNDTLNFEASANVRDGWVATIKTKVSEAKEIAGDVTGSDAYKTVLENILKPKAPEAKDHKATEEEHKAVEEPNTIGEGSEAHRTEEGKENEKEKEKEKGKEKEKDKEKEKTKSDSSSSSSSSDSEAEGEKSEKRAKKMMRSASKRAKRASFFKVKVLDRKKEGKRDGEKKEKDKKEEEAKAEESKTEPAVDVPAASGEETKLEETKADETPKGAEASATEPVHVPKNKNRYFGFFDKKKETEKRKEEDVKPEEPKVEPATEAPDTVPEEGAKPEAPAVAEGSKTPASPPKEKFLDKIFKKDRPPATPPAAVTEPKKDDDVEVKPEEGTSSEAPKETEGKAGAPSPKEAKRRSSFFHNLGKKERKSDVKSDTEDEVKSTPSSPLQKLGIFRSHSKSAKDAPKEEFKEEVPPVPEIAPAVTSTESQPTSDPAPGTTIGDVVADAVNVGQTDPIQTAA